MFSSKSHFQLRLDNTSTVPCNSFCLHFKEMADVTVLRKTDMGESLQCSFFCEFEETPLNRINDFFMHSCILKPVSIMMIRVHFS